MFRSLGNTWQYIPSCFCSTEEMKCSYCSVLHLNVMFWCCDSELWVPSTVMDRDKLIALWHEADLNQAHSYGMQMLLHWITHRTQDSSLIICVALWGFTDQRSVTIFM